MATPNPAGKFSGLRTAAAFKKVFSSAEARPVEGSPEDLQQWKEALQALHDDYLRLGEALDEQQKNVIKLRRRVGRLLALCLLGVILYGASIYWAQVHLKMLASNQSQQVADLQARLHAAESSHQVDKEAVIALEARLVKVEQAQVALPVPTPVPTMAPTAAP